MKARLFTILVSGLAFAAAPAQASQLDDLPMTEAFSSALGGYRDCVIAAVDAAPRGRAVPMANAALAACAPAGKAVRAQLKADLIATTPRSSSRDTARSVEAGMDIIEPLIADAALSRAEETVRNASTGAPPLVKGHIG